MGELFLKAVNLSIRAGWLILAVILLRLIFRSRCFGHRFQAPRWIFCLLWGIAALRLICPFSVESAVSLMSPREPIPIQTIYSAGTSNIPEIGVSSGLGNAAVFHISGSSADIRSTSDILGGIWLIAAAAMLCWGVVSYIRLARRVSTATLLCDNIRETEQIQSPIVLGFFRPGIYLPYGIAESDLDYVAAHERAHIRRGDHWWKPVGFAILCVYWFNPLLWAAYLLFCRDIEAACDEKVIRDMDSDSRRAYSAALLNCSVAGRNRYFCPAAFGEIGVRERIRNVMDYRKPAFRIVAIALIAAILAAVVFATVSAPRIDSGEVSHVLYAGKHLSKAASEELIALINDSAAFPCSENDVRPDAPGAVTDPRERELSIAMRDGSWYTLSYRYVSGFSFDPRHPGEDDYQSFLGYYDADGNCIRARRLEYNFDARLLDYLDFSGRAAEVFADAPCALFDEAEREHSIYVTSQISYLTSFFSSLDIVPVDKEFPGSPLYTVIFYWGMDNAREVEVLVNEEAISIDGQVYRGRGFEMEEILPALKGKYAYLGG